jgi:hypothetical protein
MPNLSTATAGRGDPYWYEWFVGLREVLAMIDEGSDIQSVAFQLEGIKGWDDVVVKLKSGARRCYQVKHTRDENSLTFGDLVQPDTNGDSLLGSLFQAWRQSQFGATNAECILYTNRKGGSRASQSEAGVSRPALLKFDEWLRKALLKAARYTDLRPPPKWNEAFDEWKTALEGEDATDADRLAFLNALRIRTSQEDLDGLDTKVREQLSRMFGVTEDRVIPLVDALHRALKKWTTGHGEIDAEQVFSELALPAQPQELAPAPPPPEPFFPSREPFVNELETMLLAKETPPIVFLSAEPGAGKTSVVSRIANRRIDVPLTGLIGLRYFCFEPIRPNAPVIAPDSGRVRPDMLWLSLLTQLREGLRGRLRELRVPIRNDLLSWAEAKTHVIRLATHLGNELKKPFLVVVDGIDHAARAAQEGHREAFEFFKSLPAPDALTEIPVRLLIAGQPPEHYPNYPTWLKSPHPKVKRVTFSGLATDDVRAEYLSKPSGIDSKYTEEAVRLIEEFGRGNTLATVFAVAEAASVRSVEEFESRLKTRRLGDGLDAYYNAIWEHALTSGGTPIGGDLDACIAGSLCLARSDITPALLSTAYKAWNLPIARWRELLESLRPLLIESNDGFRVRHNDVRLFLAARFAGKHSETRRRIASDLADYYISPAADNAIKHRTVFSLLGPAMRLVDAAKIFDVGWVFGAAAAGVETDQLLEEFTVALTALSELKNWDAVLSVACAAQTLERLIEQREERRNEQSATNDIPSFLSSEAAVAPKNTWTLGIFSRVIDDATKLAGGGMRDRALGVLSRWFHNISIPDVVRSISDIAVGHHWHNEHPVLQTGVDAKFLALGRLSRELGWKMLQRKPKPGPEVQAVIAFERGYVQKSAEFGTASTLDEYFGDSLPGYLDGWQRAVESLASSERWTLVAEGLERLTPYFSKLSQTFRAQAVWWALRSNVANPIWLDALTQPTFGLAGGDAPITSFLAVARALGWQKVADEASTIAADVYAEYRKLHPHEEVAGLTQLLFRAGAFMGRVHRVADRKGWDAAGGIVSEAEAKALLRALWDRDLVQHPRFQHWHIAFSLASDLAAICLNLPGRFRKAALEIALPFASKFPVDHRRAGLWKVMAAHGRRDVLLSWVQHWLKKGGAVWISDVSERRSIVSDLAPLARELGDSQLADEAENRLNWAQIGYRSEEQSFDQPIRWLAELCKQDPTAWKHEGWQLWCLTEACEDQFCSANAGGSMEAIVFGAAIMLGPSDVWRIFESTLSKRINSSWHYESRNRLGNGFGLALKNGLNLSVEDRLTLWIAVVAFCRWFDRGDIKTLAELRDELIARCSSDRDRNLLISEMRRLTPGEVTRRPEKDDNRPEAAPLDLEPTEYSVEQTLANLKAQKKTQLSEAARAIVALGHSSDGRRTSLIPEILRSVGSVEEYSTSWRWSERAPDEALNAIIERVTDEQLWNLVAAIASAKGSSRAWLDGIIDNLFRVSLARSVRANADRLRTGLKILIQMQRAWAFGMLDEQSWLPRSLPAEINVAGWPALVTKLLEVLLNSRSAEVLVSAIMGMHALVDLNPWIISELFDSLADDWPRKWLLNSAEAWAALHPSELDTVRSNLEGLVNDGDLQPRLQAWVILSKLADIQGQTRPVFPLSPTAPDQNEPVVQFEGGILDTTPIDRGFMRSLDRHGSTKGKLRRLKACGFDFSSLEGEIAEGLLAQPSEADPFALLKKEAHRDGDFLCADLEADKVIGTAISKVLRPTWCSQEILPRLVQGLMDDEDPWILRHSPLPSPQPMEWPTDQLNAFATDLDSEKILQGFRDVSAKQSIAAGWTTISASVYGAHWKEDFGLFQWLEMIPSDFEIVPLSRPTIPSGRTFKWWLGETFQPSPPNDLPVMTFFCGGSLRLVHASVVIHPAMTLWVRAGLQPNATNPLEWQLDGKPVARYERFHGPPKTSDRGAHNRQPLLDRWIMRCDVVAKIEHQINGSFRLREDFERRPGNFEE